MKPRKWTIEQLRSTATTSRSIRQILIKIGLRPVGGNYHQIGKYLEEYGISTSHFKGRGWNKGLHRIGTPRIALEDILVEKSYYQSYKLKRRLFAAKLKTPQCEFCGWSQRTTDGRIPLELDHINGNRYDNRLKNLRILCPNCHSLQPTHRGLNQKRKKA